MAFSGSQPFPGYLTCHALCEISQFYIHDEYGSYRALPQSIECHRIFGPDSAEHLSTCLTLNTCLSLSGWRWPRENSHCAGEFSASVLHVLGRRVPFGTGNWATLPAIVEQAGGRQPHQTPISQLGVQCLADFHSLFVSMWSWGCRDPSATAGLVGQGRGAVVAISMGNSAAEREDKEV
ncbi:hypothetical protein KIL84_017212 [Mauremys mutica]|uniref:Uncharacterized protein n=1 Tax=Mauremys mutica TaxID=74926 RepID=A0A9D3X5U4_9SAUR|nr:hypothetical protein KIL84_017212 [Mauremys mutica]